METNIAPPPFISYEKQARAPGTRNLTQGPPSMPFSPLLHLFRCAPVTYFLTFVAFFIYTDQLKAQTTKGPFAGFSGQWSGTGIIRQNGNPPERIRCTANYRVRGSSVQDVQLQLQCSSDNY